MAEVILGIDTGGTYTDGVLLDFESRAILRKVKTLTTKNDLTICILNALDALLPENPDEIQLVSISTTLATNAVAEGKRKPVALFLLGYDQELVKEFHFDAHLATPSYFFVEGGHDLEGNPQVPLDVAGLKKAAKGVKGRVDAVAVSGYFSPLNTTHEEQAARILTEMVDLPFVIGSQLSSRLDSIKRATTATLNASLLSPLSEFIGSIEEALRLRGVGAPLMIMHSDGSLMDAERVKAYPIETVHSGPAASAVGARFLTGVDKSLVIDIGGTTTDIAIIDKGRVNVSDRGTRVGEFNTAVRAADVRSFGLGGDSELRIGAEDQIIIGPRRVVPLSYLAEKFPQVGEYLESTSRQFRRDRISPNNLEFWFLQREPKRLINNQIAREVIKLLEKGPISIARILDKMELFHPMQFDGQQLIREEIVGRASLTPTDLFHVTGEFAPWDTGAAEVSAGIFARLLGIQVDSLVGMVKDLMAETIVEEVVKYITRQPLERYPEYVPLHDMGTWLFEENIKQNNPYLGNQIKLKMPVVGIGAPAELLLPRVAELLHTDLILPEHYEVANAIGAIVGSVVINKEAWIYPKLRNMFPVGYYLQTENERQVFSTSDLAISAAEELLTAQASAEIEKSGAQISEVEITRLPEGAESYRIRVTAIGNPLI
jgi:N-methylhydantoinase A/oxoprolinase/acetone carboxylase beta subunit